jgi:hypothetical protein
MQQIVLRQRRIVVNAQPATPAAQQQGQLRSQHVQQQQAVSVTGYKSIPYFHTKCSKHIWYRISNRHSGTYTFTQTNAAGCTSAVS